LDVTLLAAVRGTRQRKLLVGEAESVGCATGDQWQSLQDFDGGAREDGAVDVTQGRMNSATDIDDRQRAPVYRFDDSASKDFDKHWIGIHP
jgi:hypothetical protein